MIWNIIEGNSIEITRTNYIVEEWIERFKWNQIEETRSSNKQKLNKSESKGEMD